MYKTQKIQHPNGGKSLTIIGSDYLPFPPAHKYLTFLRYQETSPNTITTYATALTQWLNFLELTETPWEAPKNLTVAQFAHWLKTGLTPNMPYVGKEPEHLRSPATIALKIAAVSAFYKFHAQNTGNDSGYLAVTSHHGSRYSSPYKGFLTGVADKKPTRSPVFRIRTGNKTRTPILTPTEIKTILDACATQDEYGYWKASMQGLRNRFLFATLTETGIRLGEALSLRHQDINITSGVQPYIDVIPRQDHPGGSRVKARYERRIYIGDDLASLYSAYVWELMENNIDLVVDELGQHFILVNGHNAKDPFSALTQTNVYDLVRRLKKKLGAKVNPAWTPHWFRHTHATALLLSGAPPHIVMRRLGHQDIQTTLNTYGWVTEDAELKSISSWKDYATGWENHTAD